MQAKASPSTPLPAAVKPCSLVLRTEAWAITFAVAAEEVLCGAEVHYGVLRRARLLALLVARALDPHTHIHMGVIRLVDGP